MKMNEIQLARLLDQARSLVEEEKHLHAIQVYQRLIHLEPTFLLPHLELSSLYSEMGNLRAAASILRRAEELFPDAQEILFLLGSLHIKMGEFDRALTYLKMLSRRKLPHVHFNMGIAFYYKDDLKRAEEQFRLTLQYDPHFPKINESLGELLLKRGAFAEAIEHLKRGVDTDPYSAVVHHLLGMAYSKLFDWKRAHLEFILAVDLDPNEAVHWQLCGESLVHLRRYTEAESYLRKALELFPQSIESLVALSQVLLLKGNANQAQDYIERAAALDPQHPRVLEARRNLRIAAHHRSP
jgi:tetratricopeptide (TPR) repeat protein